MTGTSNIAGYDTTTVTTLVLRGANYCPPSNAACSGDKVHFDIAAPGFDFTQNSQYQRCVQLESDLAPALGNCEYWMIHSTNPNENCDCNAITDPTLRDGCLYFLSLKWNNPVVSYEEVSCPPEMVTPCGSDGTWPDEENIPDTCLAPGPVTPTTKSPSMSPVPPTPSTSSPTGSPVPPQSQTPVHGELTWWTTLTLTLFFI